MLNMVLVGGMVASLLTGPAATPLAAAQEQPPEGTVVIDIVTVNGTGCPPGSAAAHISPDNAAVGLEYGEYTAQVGIGSKPADSRKSCQLALAIHAPQGFTYAVAEATHQGYAHLEPGATGVVRTSYYFQGQPPSAPGSHSFSGPLDDSWQVIDAPDVTSLVYAPCGELRNLNVISDVRVIAGTSDPATTSFMTMATSSVYRLTWKQCG